ncbi:response regulator [Priestia koreensis]|uniref:response regulator n=1 Tax=Priestia koreensis TaxID=284581 RepID=UPI001F576B33|nr:response regulator [Priestia koreensis]MCM3005987.1 response regulator [Priestia koreensis]UNL85327.1 response regulator [Priestia koreensis]
MYRLLIADDEALEREGLELLIGRKMPNTFEVFQASNGRQAIELAEEYRPDIVLMDIKMPGIQGLEALKQIKAIDHRIKMVLITAYDYFSYAQEAVSIGVKDYLLKPAKREQVVETLNKLLQELEEERAKRSHELGVEETLAELIPVVESELAMMLMFNQVQEVDVNRLAQIANFSVRRGYSIIVYLAEAYADEGEKKKLHDELKNMLKTVTRCLVSPLFQNEIAIFIPVTDQYDPKQSEGFRVKINTFIEERFGLSARVVIGAVQIGLPGLQKSYQDAKQSLLPAEHQESDKQQTIIEKAQSFVNQHYAEDVSMEQVAEWVNLSSYYFSKVFKSESGQTFTDYLTEVRMEKAKQFIANMELSLKEICFLVGYKDPNYFSRAFKRYTGMTPTDYRNIL